MGFHAHFTRFIGLTFYECNTLFRWDALSLGCYPLVKSKVLYIIIFFKHWRSILVY